MSQVTRPFPSTTLYALITGIFVPFSSCIREQHVRLCLNVLSVVSFLVRRSFVFSTLFLYMYFPCIFLYRFILYFPIYLFFLRTSFLSSFLSSLHVSVLPSLSFFPTYFHSLISFLFPSTFHLASVPPLTLISFKLSVSLPLLPLHVFPYFLPFSFSLPLMISLHVHPLYFLWPFLTVTSFLSSSLLSLFFLFSYSLPIYYAYFPFFPFPPCVVVPPF